MVYGSITWKKEMEKSLAPKCSFKIFCTLSFHKLHDSFMWIFLCYSQPPCHARPMNDVRWTCYFLLLVPETWSLNIDLSTAPTHANNRDRKERGFQDRRLFPFPVRWDFWRHISTTKDNKFSPLHQRTFAATTEYTYLRFWRQLALTNRYGWDENVTTFESEHGVIRERYWNPRYLAYLWVYFVFDVYLKVWASPLSLSLKKKAQAPLVCLIRFKNRHLGKL